MRMREVGAVLLACVVLTSCAPKASQPHPSGTLEPRLTESSPMPTADKNNIACTLLTAEDRSDLTGYAMNAELPVRPEPGTDECIWVRSLRQPARAAIRVVALSTPIWSRQIVPQIRDAIGRPTTGKALAAKLEKALEDLLKPGGVPDERVCETYLLLAESRGASLGLEQVGYSMIGAMPAAFGVTCEDGIMTIAGYGEYGIRPSLALNRGVTKLVEAASARAAEALGNVEDEDQEAADSDEAAPSPTTPAEEESEDEDQSE